MLLLLLKLYAVQGLFVKYEKAVGPSLMNTEIVAKGLIVKTQEHKTRYNLKTRKHPTR